MTGVWDGLEAWAERQGLGLVYGSPEVIEMARAGVDGLRADPSLKASDRGRPAPETNVDPAPSYLFEGRCGRSRS